MSDHEQQEPAMKKFKNDRKPRAKNYSLGEVEKLKDKVKNNWAVVSGKHLNGVTKQSQDQTWKYCN